MPPSLKALHESNFKRHRLPSRPKQSPFPRFCRLESVSCVTCIAIHARVPSPWNTNTRNNSRSQAPGRKIGGNPRRSSETMDAPNIFTLPSLRHPSHRNSFMHAFRNTTARVTACYRASHTRSLPAAIV